MSYSHDVKPVAVTEGVTQGLESRDVTGQFEDSQYSQDAKYLSSLGYVLHAVLWGQPVEELGDVEWENSQDINDIEGGEEKVNLGSWTVWVVIL